MAILLLKNKSFKLLSEKVNFTFLYLIMHIIIYFIVHWRQIVIICTRNSSQQVLIGLFPNKKNAVLGQQPVTNYHDVQLVGREHSVTVTKIQNVTE